MKDRPLECERSRSCGGLFSLRMTRILLMVLCSSALVLYINQRHATIPAWLLVTLFVLAFLRAFAEGSQNGARQAFDIIREAISSRLPDTLASFATKRITPAPGTAMRQIAEFLVSPQTLERVVNPLIADLQLEYFEALSANRPYKACVVRVRYSIKYFQTLLYIPLTALVKDFESYLKLYR